MPFHDTTNDMYARGVAALLGLLYFLSNQLIRPEETSLGLTSYSKNIIRLGTMREAGRLREY